MSSVTQASSATPSFRTLGGITQALLLVATLSLGACATGNPDGKLTDLPPMEKLLESADQTLASGDRDTAVKQYTQAASANPTSAKPWVKIAQTEFEANNYPATIQAADEAMKRDTTSKEAKALAVVASLRVAVQALADMRKDVQLRGSTRSEAEQLAKSLRETLGQDVLVPAAAEKTAAPQAKPRKATATPTTRAATPTTGTTAVATPAQTPTPANATTPAANAKPAAAPAKSAKSGNDPFSALQ
ncbi:hypothetical protein [Niveibacterium sp. SC-1]|uniref:hypothetical protein n=1 Tax=Niveibacterium sp. SC-1 TaxID=3135646 RepID=UPI00311F66F6